MDFEIGENLKAAAPWICLTSCVLGLFAAVTVCWIVDSAPRVAGALCSLLKAWRSKP